jgi:hypothetical protein
MASLEALAPTNNNNKNNNNNNSNNNHHRRLQHVTLAAHNGD